MIIQGGNQPIVIKWSTTSVSDIVDISIVLCLHSTTLKHNADKIIKQWSKSDLEFNSVDNTVSAPLTQEETIEMQPGNASVEIKWTLSDGYVHHATVAAMIVSARCDETILN